METNETSLTRKIMLAIGSREKFRIFRNNVGAAWVGKSKRFTHAQTVNVKSGDVLVQQARFFEAGLCTGSSDLIGLESLVVTPEMVGKNIAIFVAVEVKVPGGSVRKEQVNFLEMVNKMGGKGIICRDEKNIKL